MHKLLSIFFAVAMVSYCSLAAAQSTQPAEAADRVDQLVQQLGSEEFAKREAAHNELRSLGARAKEALARGVESENPEIRDRSRSLLEQLEGHGLADSNDPPVRRMQIRGMNVGPVGVAGNLRVQMIGPGGGRQAMRDENGRVVSLVEDAQGITITIREERDGKQVEETFSAKTPEELKQKNAEVYEEYEKFGPAPVPQGMAGKGIAIDGDLRAIILDNHLRDLEQAQRQAEAMADHVLKQLDRDIRALQDRVLGQDLLQRDDLKRLLDERVRIADMLNARLGNRQAALPERPDRGLGVLVNEPDELMQSHLGKGLVVERVLPGTVAEEAGIQRFDFIKRVNDREISNVTELREAIEMEGKKTIELLRKGEMKLITIE